jgi:thioredoxin-like negative regulator of GroEL
MAAPVLGLVDMAFLAVAPASNHLQYLPLMGPVALGGYGLARLHERWRGGPAAAAAPGLALAAVLLLASSTWRRAGAFEDELSLWTAAVREAPESPSARHYLAILQLGAGRTAEGVAQLEAMARVAHEPGRRAVAEMLAAFHAGRRAEAVSAAEALLAHERALEARREAAVVLLYAGDPERGIAVLQELVARAPSATDYVYQLASALAGDGRLQEAADVLIAHLRRWPGDPDLEQAAAFVLLRAGRPEDALERAAAVVGTSPQDPRARAQLDAWRAQAGWR